jgi:endonuclease/exonuclease/phosphatase family metal-dependent hydrolase
MGDNCINNIKVMTYNIHAGIGMDRRSDIARIAGVIGENGADIIALNEVDNATERSLGIDQAGFIAGKLNFYSAYGKTIYYRGGQYGNAVLSKYPILYTKNHSLPRIEAMNEEPRCMLECRIDINGCLINILAAHLSLSRQERIETVKYISEVISGLNGPIILLGDFNLRYKTELEELKPLLGVLKDTSAECGQADIIKTFNSSSLESKIDYILVSREFQVVSSYIIETKASDHVPLVAGLIITA